MATTWILVSDAARARLFETSGKGTPLTEVACYANPDLRGLPSKDSPERQHLPRTHESASQVRHAIEPHTTRREKSTHQFADLLVRHLSEGRSHARYDRLFLVAPPHFLGALRESLGDPDEAHLAGELANDLVGQSAPELFKRLHKEYPHEFSEGTARVNA